MVGDGHTMGVTTQVLQHVLWPTQGALQVAHPILAEQRAQPGSKNLGQSEEFQISLEVELASLEGLLESVDELAAKNFTQHFFGKKVVVS